MESGGRSLGDQFEGDNVDDKTGEMSVDSESQTGNGGEGNGDADSRLDPMDLNANSAKKRRKNKSDKERHLEEPQFVTKQTKSGRLVKMKISRDYDYTSEQELEASKKKKSNYPLIYFVLFAVNIPLEVYLDISPKLNPFLLSWA